MEISVENLTKRFGPQAAVDNISFKVKTGEILGFLGPNGAGKTTTMKIITSYMAPTSGDVRIGGLSIRGDADSLSEKIGYLPENNPLYHDMFVVEYLQFIGALQGILKVDLMDKVREIIRLCGLNEEKHKRIGELSKGYRQRVGLAQAMINDPEILLLDEPTSGLDPNQIIEIRNLIKELGSAKTVILSTHILSEVEATCDRILIINKGKIVADGSPSTLRKQSQGREVLRVNFDDIPDLAKVKQALEKLDTIASVNLNPNNKPGFQIESRPGTSSYREIFKLCVVNGWILSELTPLETTLEDVFRELTL